MLYTLSEEELAEAILKEELKKDFGKLFKEAKKTQGDSVSKRIVGSIDEWLRIELECAIKEIEDENPMEQLYEDLDS